MLDKVAIFFLFFILSIIKGQVITVLDIKTNKPLSDVNVFIQKKGTTTDFNGTCYLDKYDEQDIITFSLIGYKTINLKKSKIPSVLYMEHESIPLELINVYGLKKRKQLRIITKLERDVRKVYPYAKTLASLIVDYNDIIDSLDNYAGYKKVFKKRKIFREIEDELLLKYGYSVRKLSKNQGRILIRLVDRETKNTSYSIIKHFRNTISAGFWQFAARIFGHNLKSNYNPDKGEDKIIEFIINRIEAKS